MTLPEIDETDRKILEMLQKNGRLAFRRIAEELGVSEATVFLRVKKMKRRGVIKRFAAIVSPELVGKGLTAFIMIKAEPQRLSEVLDALKKINDIYEIYDVTGIYYGIVKIRVGSREELAKIIDTIGLIDGIMSTETTVVLRSIKEETSIKI